MAKKKTKWKRGLTTLEVTKLVDTLFGDTDILVKKGRRTHLIPGDEFGRLFPKGTSTIKARLLNPKAATPRGYKARILKYHPEGAFKLASIKDYSDGMCGLSFAKVFDMDLSRIKEGDKVKVIFKSAKA